MAGGKQGKPAAGAAAAGGGERVDGEREGCELSCEWGTAGAVRGAGAAGGGGADERGTGVSRGKSGRTHTTVGRGAPGGCSLAAAGCLSCGRSCPGAGC